MLEPRAFDIRDVSAWPTEADEQMGSKTKSWLEDPLGRSHLFKVVREDHLGTRYGDDWAEKIAAELATLLGVPAAQVDLARRAADAGVICLRVNQDPDIVELAHGNELLGAEGSGYDMQRKREHPHYTVEAVAECLADTEAPAGRLDLEPLRGFGVWAGYLVFDALIANTDRHHENWGVLIDRRDGSTRLAPSFDHGSSLGFNVSSADLDRFVRDPAALERWARRGRSGHFAGRPRLTDVAAEALRLAGPQARDLWTARVRQLRPEAWNSVIHRIPDARMSEHARTFVGKVVELNRRRVLDVCDRAS